MARERWNYAPKLPQQRPLTDLYWISVCIILGFSFFFLCYAVDLELGQVFIHAVIQHCTTVGFLL